MSDTSAFGFGKFVPGFDFLQSLTQAMGKPPSQTGPAAGLSNWVAPTLNVQELDKRIQELKAVQFWLEQNGTALKATIQALEVQKMTLTTLQGMNVNMAELSKAFTARAPAAAASKPEVPPSSVDAPSPDQPREAGKTPGRRRPGSAPTGPAVDPMAWWGALTQQFQNIAATAMHEAAAHASTAEGSPVKAQAAAPTASAGEPPAAKRARKASAAPSKATGQRKGKTKG